MPTAPYIKFCKFIQFTIQAQWFHQIVDRPAAGVRHVFLPVSDEASYQCKAINIDRDLKGSIQVCARVYVVMIIVGTHLRLVV